MALFGRPFELCPCPFLFFFLIPYIFVFIMTSPIQFRQRKQNFSFFMLQLMVSSGCVVSQTIQKNFDTGHCMWSSLLFFRIVHLERVLNDVQKKSIKHFISVHLITYGLKASTRCFYIVV